ncbi:type VI secretion system contractile sheath small subunit [Paludibacterium denitrificans]|uniref:Type VI secretion system contractile sheath small subunit n=1 Tax=Paludibacterium denitrificans TaxID=2675226 RepID=A0A844GE22_9NEIS|nr:type VI secretion system contractile sheath small subunit [Paludibacterium denitrificans]MTD33570.1 type VI secretion system contractile sheath small subunit [Paludibacterium denitrificans]
MGNESTQKKLSRVRPPRVQITYDVEIGDAIETKELPFVMGVLGDYSGHRKEPAAKLKDPARKFVQIDRDNFDEVLKGMAPRLAMKVDNKLADDDTQLGVELNFECLADFEPQNVAKQVDPLKKLVDARQRLSELRNKMAGNDKLEALLDDIVRDTEKLRQISLSGSNDKAGE